MLFGVIYLPTSSLVIAAPARVKIYMNKTDILMGEKFAHHRVNETVIEKNNTEKLHQNLDQTKD